MGKYLLQAKYTADGARGVMSEGGTSRRNYVQQYVESIGGRVEAFYFGFGHYDAYVIVDAPNDVTVAAASLTVGGSGVVSIDTVVLLTPEQIDEAARTTGSYRPPGG